MTLIPDFPLRVLFVVLMLGLQYGRAYDSPDFDIEIFDTDALLVPQNELDTVIEALNASACNFPESKLIDEDLQEKALALALALDPLNMNSRNAHFALMKGKQPAKTAFFQSSVSEIAERLWEASEKMSGRKAQPESRKLAGYLRHLALILHPSPPAARVRDYVRKSEQERLVKWEKFVTLQPQSNSSSRKIDLLVKDLSTTRPAGKGTAGKGPVGKGKGKGKGPGSKSMPGPRPGINISTTGNPGGDIPIPGLNMGNKPARVEIPFVARTRNPATTGNRSGIVSLRFMDFNEVRSAIPDSPPSMRLIADPEGGEISGIKRAELLSKGDLLEWPEGMIAMARFEPDSPSAGPARADLSVAICLLMQSALTERKPAQDLVFAGMITDMDSREPVFSVGDQIADVLDRAKAMKAEFLVVPESQYNFYVQGAIDTGQLEYLFDPQLISYSNWDQLKDTAFGKGATQRAAASVEFKRIQAVQDQMPLVDLAKNARIQERLKAIVESYPQHMSARVMLAYGESAGE